METIRSYASWDPLFRQAVQTGLDRLEHDARRWAATELASLRERVEDVTDPYPDLYEAVVEELAEVHHQLSSLMTDDFGELRHSLSEWRGDAAENFASKFYHPFGDARDNQAVLVDNLAAMLAATKAVTDLAQHSLMNTVLAARDALHDQLRLRSIGEHGPPLRKVPILGSSAGGVLSAIAFGTPWVAVGFQAVSAGLGYAASRVPEDELDEDGQLQRLEGQSAQALATSLSDAVSEVLRRAGKLFDNVRQELADIEGRLEETRRAGLVVPQRPTLADG